MEKIIIQHGKPPKTEEIIGGFATREGKCQIKCDRCGCVWETDDNMHIVRGMTMEKCPECGKMCTGLCQNPLHSNIIPI